MITDRPMKATKKRADTITETPSSVVETNWSAASTTAASWIGEAAAATGLKFV